AGSFIQKTRGQVRHAFFARGIKCRPTVKANRQRDQGIGVILDQPGFDAAGTHHPLDRGGCVCPSKQPAKSGQCRESRCAKTQNTIHWTAPTGTSWATGAPDPTLGEPTPGNRMPVTLFSRFFSTSRAACSTSSALTAAMLSGHDSTWSSDRPL